MIKLIGIDIDGTLLTDDRKLNQDTASALQTVTKKGVEVVLASGRPYTNTIDNLMSKFDKFDGYYIAYNGEAIYNINTKKCIYENSLDKKDIEYAYDKVKEYNKLYGASIYVYVDDEKLGSIIKAESVNEYTLIEEKNNHILIKEINSLLSLDKAHKLMLALDPKYVPSLYEKIKGDLGNKYTVTTSMSCYIEILKKDINKYNGLKMIAALLNIKDDEIMGIGDSINDLEMIKYSHIGICMGNGKKEVLDSADFATSTNNESGIAKALNYYKELF